MKSVTKIIFTDDDGNKFFGEGPMQLLRAIERTGSLRSAAMEMEMAYSKAWRIIRTAEEVFGCKLLSSTIGGQHGGGAVLTPQAEQLLAAYRAYESDVKAYSQAKFNEAFDFYKDLDKT